MADVFSLLRKDHAEVQRQLQLLASGATGPMVDRLVASESRHEAAEEMYFWPAVRTRARGGAELADEALAQEQAAKRILEDLRRAAPGMESFDRLLEAFAEAARRHIEFEESQAWPALREALDTADRMRLGAKLLLAKRMGPTRPHPHGPDHPGGLKTLGTVVAFIDKAADAMMRRNRP